MSSISLQDFTRALHSEQHKSLKHVLPILTPQVTTNERLDSVLSEEEETNFESRRSQKRDVLIQAPLPKKLRERVDREIAYHNSTREVNKWSHIVKANRARNQLVFPLNAPPAEDITPDVTICTDLHRAIDELYQEHGLPTEAQLGESCQLPMYNLTEQEVITRQTELARLRARLSYKGQKDKQHAKIKSKRFHKELKKDREQKAVKDLLADPQNFKNSKFARLKAEMERAKERVSLKTRRVSKWAREMLQRKYESNDKGAISHDLILQQIQDKERLRQQLLDKPINEDEENTINENDEELGSNYEEEQAQKNTDFPVIRGRILFDSNEAEQDANTHVDEGNFDFLENDSSAKNKSVIRAAFSGVSGLFDNTNEKEKQSSVNDVQAEEIDEDFKTEKKEIIENQAPKIEDLTLPGWGEWAGEGVPTNPKKFLKVLPGVNPEKRKDVIKHNVIINEKLINRIPKEFKLNKPPYPFKSIEEYHEHLQKDSIGPEWLTTLTFHKLIKPKLVTSPGMIIEPLRFVKQSSLPTTKLGDKKTRKK